MGDRVGQRLGNYRLVRQLGHGGFAEVYLGEHHYLKSYAALKLLHTSLKHEDVERFLTEAQTLVQLKHPHIIRVLEFGMEQGTPVLIMDYASGGTMRQRCPAGARLIPTTVGVCIKQIASALQYAHNRNIIHRDVKPENILFGSEQQLLLGDFGLALFAPSPDDDSTGEMAGSLAYIAPEQLRGKPTFASDQYSLAVIAYEWLAGTRPFVGTSWELIQQHSYETPPSLQATCPDLPPSIDAVLQRALAKEPQRRFVSVQAFALALEHACQHDRRDEDDEALITAPLSARTLSPLSSSPERSSFATRTQRALYISAAALDMAFAQRLKADLKQRGVHFVNDSADDASDTLAMEDVVRQALRAVSHVLVVVTSHMRASHRVKEQLRIAHTYQRQLIFLWAAGDEMAAVLLDMWGKTLPVDVIDARGPRYAVALDEIVASLDESVGVSPLRELSLSITSSEPRNPYKGLRAFRTYDGADFFGRDALIGELVRSIQDMLASETEGQSDGRFLTVVGPSGSGKSSVVMAGLLPRLQNGILAGSERWLYLEPIVPGIHPLASLVFALAPYLPGRSLERILAELEDDSTGGLHILATQVVQASGAKVLLVVDQFEEVFTQTRSEKERQRFIDLLLTAATEPGGPVVVVLTLRADFSDRPMHYPELSRMIEAHHLAVHPMELLDLRAVIEQPAALPDVRLLFEGTLVGDLLFETQGQVGALPLLEFTLDQLFQQREGQWLTLQAYQQLGGVKGALAKHAEMTYETLPSDEHRALTRALFLRLIEPGFSEQDTTRRRAVLSEIELPDAGKTAIIQATANMFVSARLLTANEVHGIVTIEVSHEALIREWARLSTWLREARDDIAFQHTISKDVAEWEQRGKPGDRLYRGSQLKEARAWAARNMPSRHETAFLHVSHVRRLRSVISVIAIVVLLLSSTGVAGWLYLHRSPDPTLVTNLSDDGVGSLRWAIANAPPGSTITFDASVRGTSLRPNGSPSGSGDLIIGRNLTIRGPGAGMLAINGGKYGRVFDVSKGVTVTISDLTIENGEPGGGSTSGGGIYNSGTLILSNCIVSGNQALNGGGIDNEGTLTLIKSRVSNNFLPTPSASGGGIYNGGKLTLIDSTISGNTALTDSTDGTGYGGGIDNESILTLMNSTISGNSASTGGGGIMNKGLLTIASSTIAGNTTLGTAGNSVPTGGGGIINEYMLTITNSTIADNVSSGPGSQGGGILDQGIISNNQPVVARAGLSFCTIFGNRAAVGADLAVEDVALSIQGKFTPREQFSQVKIGNSIVVSNPAHVSQDIAGTLTSNGYNLFQNNAGASFDPSTGALHGTDRMASVYNLSRVFAAPLGLRNNVSSTATYVLAPGGPASDVIPLQYCQIKAIFDSSSQMYTDQRGMKRPDESESTCDIGAYE